MNKLIVNTLIVCMLFFGFLIPTLVSAGYLAPLGQTETNNPPIADDLAGYTSVARIRSVRATINAALEEDKIYKACFPSLEFIMYWKIFIVYRKTNHSIPNVFMDKLETLFENALDRSAAILKNPHEQKIHGKIFSAMNEFRLTEVQHATDHDLIKKCVEFKKRIELRLSQSGQKTVPQETHYSLEILKDIIIKGNNQLKQRSILSKTNRIKAEYTILQVWYLAKIMRSHTLEKDSFAISADSGFNGIHVISSPAPSLPDEQLASLKDTTVQDAALISVIDPESPIRISM